MPKDQHLYEWLFDSYTTFLATTLAIMHVLVKIIMSYFEDHRIKNNAENDTYGQVHCNNNIIKNKK